jgi:hypothetical protein
VKPKAPPFTLTTAVVFMAEVKEAPLRAGSFDEDTKSSGASEKACGGFDGVGSAVHGWFLRVGEGADCVGRVNLLQHLPLGKHQQHAYHLATVPRWQPLTRPLNVVNWSGKR